MKNIISLKKKELSSLPHGYLIMRNGCFYHRSNGKDIGISKKLDLIKKLARKRFLQMEIPILEKNEQLIKEFKDKYEAVTPKAIIEKMSKAYHKLPINYFLGVDEFKVIQSENPYKREQLIYKTNAGVYMRTKSEVIIGNFLEALGIRYWYEPRLMLGNHVIYPDFLIENPFDHSVIPLEHLGMLGNNDYDERNKKKLKEYIEHGYFPNHNFICTYEHDIMEPGRLKTILSLFGII